MKVEYFPETKEFLVGCKGFDGIYLGKFSLDFEYTPYNQIVLDIPSGCKNPNILHLIYSTRNQGYSIIGDIGDGDCVNKRVFDISNIIPSNKVNDFPIDEPGILICSHYYSYEGTSCIDNVEDGFYCNDTNKMTIDKCHDECISCIEGPKNEYTNCNKCKNDKYVEFGKCVSSCTNNDIFIDPIDNTNLKCKCPYEKCSYCTPNSYQYEQCIYCNTEKGYYPKEKDDSNVGSFINCYKDPDGYYLKNNSYYKSCYSTCKRCNGHGKDENNYCKECFEGFLLVKEENNKCFNCSYNYYFDSENNIKCTEDNNCPSDFPKLINSTKKCIKNCSEDNNYRYEYNNYCYEYCPSGTHTSNNNNYLCESNLICPFLYSYNRTVCLNEVPVGY